jgi:hypothetical protein
VYCILIIWLDQKGVSLDSINIALDLVNATEANEAAVATLVAIATQTDVASTTSTL